MASKTVRSLAGQDIEIVSDADWAKLTGGTEKGLRLWSRSKPLAIRYLWVNGTVTDPNGGATVRLQQGIFEAYQPDHEFESTALTMMMKDPVNFPAFERDVIGKRTYSIRLVALPETWYRKLRIDLKDGMNQIAKEFFEAIPIEGSTDYVTVPETIVSNGTQPEVITAEEFEASIMPPIDDRELFIPFDENPAPVLDVSIASQVAMEMLTKVVEIISAGTPASMDATVRQLQNTITEVEHRLSQRLEENQKLRRERDGLREELQAVKYERDGLRQRLRNTESNLTAALKGEAAAAVNGEIQRRVESIMRQSPRPKGE